MEKSLYFQAPDQSGRLKSLEDPKFSLEYTTRIKTNQMPKLRAERQ